MTMNLDRVGFESEPERFAWTPQDCSLYAIAIGAGLDDVAFTTEGNAGATQLVYPSFPFAVVSALADSWPDPCFGTGDFPLERAVLGEQALELHRPVATAGEVDTVARVAGIYDKGSGALVVIEQRATDHATGEPAFTSTVRMFITGEGGFGGEREAGPGREPLPDSPPDHSTEARTLPIQTLLYRHGGHDANPLHFDPEFARRGGLGRADPHRPERARLRVPGAGPHRARRRPDAPALDRGPLLGAGLQRRHPAHRDLGRRRRLGSLPRPQRGGHGARGSRPGLLRLTSQVLGPPITP